MVKGLISVIMPTYNRTSVYLKQSIESILNQTYSDFEFIIVDDGSSNGTKELIKSYDDPRIRLLINEQNMGLPRSLNRALDECRGEYIARMDDDDIAYPTRFEKQFAYMRQHPDVIVCGTWVGFMDDNGQLTGTTIRDCIEDMDSYRITLLFGNIPTIFHPSSFVNRRLFLENHLCYESEYDYAEDYKLWLRCSTIGKCAILREVLMKYRRHSGSVSIVKKQAQKDVDFAIMQLQLDSLHLTLTDEVKPLHYHLMSDNWDLQNRYDLKLKKWIKDLIKANGRYRIYNQTKLKKLLWYRWSLICRLAINNEKNFRKKASIILSLSPMGFLYCLKRATEKMTEILFSHE